MLFSTWQFGLFFIVFVLVYFGARESYRLAVVILGSTFFYAWWKPSYVWLPYVLTIVGYAGAIWIDKTEGSARNRNAACVLVLLFMPLAIFKYADFVWVSALETTGRPATRLLNAILPLGVSFITFTIAAYVIDVWKRQYVVEHSLPRLLAHVLFFPHLIAGPIIRPGELLPQLASISKLHPIQVRFAFLLIAFGLAKKLVLADEIAPFVERAFGPTAADDAWSHLIAIYGFSVQIYCDFSGYSDMAVGLALLLGIRLPENFRAPYATTSIIDFWRRWHITLSNWLRDYLYIPMGGNRTNRTSINILVTMLLGGLWHGANWTFLAWGGLHGLALIMAHHVRKAGVTLPTTIGWLLTFNFVTFAWIFFRAPDFGTAFRVLQAPFVLPYATNQLIEHSAFALALFAIFAVVHPIDRFDRIRNFVDKVPALVSWSAVALLFLAAASLSQGNSAKFIYFDF